MDEGTERGELGLQTAAVALDEVHSVTQYGTLTIHMVSHGFWFHVFSELY